LFVRLRGGGMGKSRGPQSNHACCLTSWRLGIFAGGRLWQGAPPPAAGSGRPSGPPYPSGRITLKCQSSGRPRLGFGAGKNFFDHSGPRGGPWNGGQLSSIQSVQGGKFFGVGRVGALTKTCRPRGPWPSGPDGFFILAGMSGETCRAAENCQPCGALLKEKRAIQNRDWSGHAHKLMGPKTSNLPEGGLGMPQG